MKLPTEELHEWFVDGQEADHDYMIVFCHIYSEHPFPVYSSRADFVAVRDKYLKEANTALEVYDLKLDWHTQLQAKRANYGPSV
jgi:hypothetical protein